MENEMNPNCNLITGNICGIKIQEIEDPLIQKIRYLDKVVDELAKGKAGLPTALFLILNIWAVSVSTYECDPDSILLQ